MNKFNKAVSQACLITITFFAASSSFSDEWNFGVGTGLFALNVEGDLGFGTNLPPGFSVTELDWDFDDINNVLDGASGIGGFAQNGDWKINYALGQLTLAGETSQRELSFTTTGVDINIERSLAAKGLSVYGGVRHTEHKLDFKGPIIQRKITEDWLDAYVGVAYVMDLGGDMSWNTRFDVGAGGSDGSATLYTGLNFMLAPNWAASFYGKYYTVDYETGNKGDVNWYNYDNDEFGLGLGISYLW